MRSATRKGARQNSLELAGRTTRLRNGNRGHVEFVYDEIDAFFAAVVFQIQGGHEGFLVPFPGKAELSTDRLMTEVERYLKEPGARAAG